MGYEFSKKKTATFKFYTNRDASATTTFAGINATLTSAETICNGVNSLMAIGGNNPEYEDAIRTAQETVWYNDDPG